MLRGFLLIAIVAIAATGAVGFRYAGPGEESFVVEYKVVCDQCNVTFRNEKGQSAEVTAVKNNWNYKFTGNPGQFVYVSASNDNGTPVKVGITKGGQEIINGASEQKDKDARAGVILEAGAQ